MPREDLIQFRRGTEAQRQSVDPVLADGEPAFIRDTNQLIIGDGVTDATDLAPIGGVSLANLLVTVDASDDLSTSRPSVAGAVYWLFDDDTVDPGTAGENIVNAVPGDFWFVPES